MRAIISFMCRGNSGCSTKMTLRDFGSVKRELSIRVRHTLLAVDSRRTYGTQIVDTPAISPRVYGPPPPSQDLTLSYTSTSEARIQNFLEQNAGDYSRYFPQVSNSLQRIPDPVQTAQLTLARKRDMGLKVKQKALGIVSQLARTSTGPTTKLVT